MACYHGYFIQLDILRNIPTCIQNRPIENLTLNVQIVVDRQLISTLIIHNSTHFRQLHLSAVFGHNIFMNRPINRLANLAWIISVNLIVKLSTLLIFRPLSCRDLTHFRKRIGLIFDTSEL